ncbi:hypothetical protein CEXT_24411 [Caerostris extrusa]|uniref:Uncharacterized protein n=1 Tax=Caerostris extrusa TaxID=172846 RepID=A0AAV4SJY3_CAEEX|nr:hypothetical protein CEXT_24411 [Caerostris extrusa]
MSRFGTLTKCSLSRNAKSDRECANHSHSAFRLEFLKSPEKATKSAPQIELGSLDFGLHCPAQTDCYKWTPNTK